MTAAVTLAPAPRRWLGLAPGLAAGAVAASLAVIVGHATPLPAAIVALALGLAVGATRLRTASQAGLEVWAKPGLRLGVALLGAQLGGAEFLGLGLPALLAAGAIVSVGLAAGTGLGLLIGLPLAEALVAACAVSICGASAAMAAAQVLPASPTLRQHTALVVIGVNLLSTAAMVGYPLLAHALQLSPRAAGLFFGLSIHDVAQVAGAGNLVSPEAERIGALAKLSRVLWLGPAICAVALVTAGRADSGSGRGLGRLAPPTFVLGFAALALARALGLIPQVLLPLLQTAAQLFLAGGVFALAAALPPRAILACSPRLAVLLVAATLVVAVAAFAALQWL
jgi:uncharacterized membrane protein YadS